MAIREEGSYALHLPSVFNQQKEKTKRKIKIKKVEIIFKFSKTQGNFLPGDFLK